MARRPVIPVSAAPLETASQSADLIQILGHGAQLRVFEPVTPQARLAPGRRFARGQARDIARPCRIPSSAEWRAR
ncbi:hypothetical protein PUN4_280288 [Paraburkholderia unamae]|nr:hypothetical protein PUN4_280288 [Paraburkholderia unamae]